ncbi:MULTISPECIES: hypothetical protein [Nocardiaceae]|uniref:VOC domain-containing protein n=1 Tax=Rhodococcoides yunnanense TaxID=278209 RepID=A0ABU4BGN4_9NOCA|nr:MULTISPECIES: hypothetical protein [Rhodococcus]MDI9897248.1 hypothetical protein [Rhodococcus sp. IEGM 1381]MDV6263244.1 hypothetical protein [Rhodococcus yunnanensis]
MTAMLVTAMFGRSRATRVTEELFDAAYARLVGSRIEHSADPRMTQPGTVNTAHCGRGVCFRDPTGHFLEMLTHSYLTGQGEPVR